MQLVGEVSKRHDPDDTHSGKLVGHVEIAGYITCLPEGVKSLQTAVDCVDVGRIYEKGTVNYRVCVSDNDESCRIADISQNMRKN